MLLKQMEVSKMRRYIINFVIGIFCFFVSFIGTTAMLRAVYLYRLLPFEKWLEIIFS